MLAIRVWARRSFVLTVLGNAGSDAMIEPAYAIWLRLIELYIECTARSPAHAAQNGTEVR
jgi:hypothetical protein